MFVNRDNMSSLFYDYPTVPVSPSDSINIVNTNPSRNDIVLPTHREPYTHNSTSPRDPYIIPVKRETPWLSIFIFVLIGIVIAFMINFYIRLKTIEIGVSGLTH